MFLLKLVFVTSATLCPFGNTLGSVRRHTQAVLALSGSERFSGCTSLTFGLTVQKSPRPHPLSLHFPLAPLSPHQLWLHRRRRSLHGLLSGVLVLLFTRHPSDSFTTFPKTSSSPTRRLFHLHFLNSDIIILGLVLN